MTTTWNDNEDSFNTAMQVHLTTDTLDWSIIYPHILIAHAKS